MQGRGLATMPNWVGPSEGRAATQTGDITLTGKDLERAIPLIPSTASKIVDNLVNLEEVNEACYQHYGSQLLAQD